MNSDQQPSTLESEPSVSTALEDTPTSTSRVVVEEQPPRQPRWRRYAGVSALVVGFSVSGVLMLNSSQAAEQRQSELARQSVVKSQTIGLSALSQSLAAVSDQPSGKLRVNGQVSVSDSLVLQPADQPNKAVAGLIYYDKASNNVLFYNGSQFLSLAGSSVSNQVFNNQVTNLQVTNVSGGAGGIGADGVAGSLALFTAGDQLGSSFISQNGSRLNVGNGVGVQTVVVGSTAAGSATIVQGGAGNLSLATGSTEAASGSIFISTGNSSTTGSGNIIIDNGSSTITGELVENKTFEGGTEDMIAWFGDTVTQSTVQAHSGVYSLAATLNDGFWGVIEVLPGTTVVTGHQYYFSTWVRAGSAPRLINGSAAWAGGGGATVNFNAVTDSTTGWTEITGLGTAPAGATSVYLRFSSIGTVGEVHYFDDITVTDLSSSSAIAALELGSTNAKLITIGNLNQIGATSIFGGSGINLASGAAGINLNGGVLTLTGNAASSLNTTSGALTLTSAASTVRGIGTASSGNGGDLNLRGGNAGGGTSNGGSIIIQGGMPTGAGIGGGVIVQAQADSAAAFQVQGSAGGALLVADTVASILTIAGTDANFATFAVTDAHIRSTQTSLPTAALPTNCGTGATSAVTAASTDVAGSFMIMTGTGGGASTCDTVISFHRPYAAAPKSIVVVGKSDVASALRQVYVTSAGPASFTVSFAVSAAGANNTVYQFSYWVIE